MKESFLIIVKGIVQGVGFRPFIHKLAEKYKIKGNVAAKIVGISYVHIYKLKKKLMAYGFEVIIRKLS